MPACRAEVEEEESSCFAFALLLLCFGECFEYTQTTDTAGDPKESLKETKR